MNYWNTVKIEDIKKVGGTGGRFGSEPEHTYFTITMKNDHQHTFHYANRDAYKFRNEIKQLYNEFNKIEEYYLLENETFLRVNGKSILYGCRVENNLNEYEYKTLLEIDRLRKQGKIVDEGWRHMCYICPIEIKLGKIYMGKIDDAALEQIKALGFEFDIEKGNYSSGELRQ